MGVEEAFIALQLVVGIARSLQQGNDPTPEQSATLDEAEALIKAKLDADLAAIVAPPNTAQL